jgi:hypothetical protein
MYAEDGNPNAWQMEDWLGSALVHMNGWHLNAFQ